MGEREYAAWFIVANSRSASGQYDRAPRHWFSLKGIRFPVPSAKDHGKPDRDHENQSIADFNGAFAKAR
jgi:hypothetical protein